MRSGAAQEAPPIVSRIGVLEGLRAPDSSEFAHRHRRGHGLVLSQRQDVQRSQPLRAGGHEPRARPAKLAGAGARKGEFLGTNRYDWSVQAQSAAGLKVLEVDHLRRPGRILIPSASRWICATLTTSGAPWPNAGRARSWPSSRGTRRTSPCSAATPAAKWHPSRRRPILASRRAIRKPSPASTSSPCIAQATLRDLHENEAWPYFDTFNLHHYERFDTYPKLYADFRAVSAGRPLWVTECSVPVKWHGDEQLQEPTEDGLLVQSERVPMTYACAIHEGAQAVFYFILPHFVEGQTQFGVVRPDLTPRPAYVALAAAGRLLADAQPLGRVKAGDERSAGSFSGPSRMASARMCWSPGPRTRRHWSCQSRQSACFDHLGRARDISGKVLKLGRAPLYAVLPPGHTEVVPAPEAPKRLPGQAFTRGAASLAPRGRASSWESPPTRSRPAKRRPSRSMFTTSAPSPPVEADPVHVLPVRWHTHTCPVEPRVPHQ